MLNRCVTRASKIWKRVVYRRIFELQNATGNFGNREECSLEKQRSVKGSKQLLKTSGRVNMFTQVDIGTKSDVFFFYTCWPSPLLDFFVLLRVQFCLDLKKLIKVGEIFITT